VKSLYFIIPIFAALMHLATRDEKQAFVARAEENPATIRGPFPSTDTVTGGELSGKIILEGQAPKNHVINMAADPDCVKSHTGPATSEEVVVGPENVLANVVVYISEGLGERTFDLPKEPALIEQKGCQYQAHVVALQAGQKLLVENKDPTSHNIHPLPANNREWNRSQPRGVPPIEASFGREEIAIPVKCNIHPWMKGYIAVFKHPYFAVTGKDGRFLIKDLPPGNYTVTAWHEKFGTLSQKLSVGPKEDKQLEFVFKSQAAE
jgi:hypothetical protein